MSLKQRTARYETRHGGAGTGPQHKRPESHRQKMASLVNVRRIVRGYQYYSKEPSESHPSVQIPSEQTQPETKPRDSKRFRRRALNIGIPLLAAAVGAGVAGEIVRADANPAAANQAALAEQVGALAKGAYFAAKNINKDGGTVSTQGDTTEVSSRVASGDIETVQITRSDIGPDGTVQPNSTHIVSLSLTRSQGTGSAVTTKYSLIKGQWLVSKDIHDQGRDERIETVVEGGETHIQRTELSTDGTAVSTGIVSAPKQVNEIVASINAESDRGMTLLDQKAITLPPDSVTLL